MLIRGGDEPPLFQNMSKTDTMNKKLRLLVTAECPNKCPICCNNRFDIGKIPVVDRFDYDEIMITGGEPLLFTECRNLMITLKDAALYCGRSVKLYIYTAKFDIESFCTHAPIADGFVYTPHSQKDVEAFLELNAFILLHQKSTDINHLSLRLNVFPEIRKYIPVNTDLALWKIKEIQWIKDCPVPDGEDFRRIKNLFSFEKYNDYVKR